MQWNKKFIHHWTSYEKLEDIKMNSNITNEITNYISIKNMKIPLRWNLGDKTIIIKMQSVI
jgi:hypothetical protein